jgi:hypothetical protein
MAKEEARIFHGGLSRYTWFGHAGRLMHEGGGFCISGLGSRFSHPECSLAD